MPDLSDLDADLRALLAARAVDAPAVPAPTDALVRRVRRRQTVRATAAVATGSLALVTIVAVAAAAVRPDRATVTPAKPAPSPSALTDDRYEFCPTTFTATTVAVSTFSTELKFDHGCYAARAGVPLQLSFTNTTTTPHNVVVGPADGEPFAKTETVFADASRKSGFDTIDLGRLDAGDYKLTCDVHPSMTAQLVVR